MILWRRPELRDDFSRSIDRIFNSGELGCGPFGGIVKSAVEQANSVCA
jgi:hypothetical protein